MSKPIVFLHGWGQSRQIWYRQMETFPDAIFLDLPGHGSNHEEETNISDWIESVAAQLPDQPSVMVGWSLGGMIAMQLALQCPEKIAALVLISTTPSFCRQKNWAFGCSHEWFEAFESGIKNNASKTISRFFALMLHGDAMDRSEYNQIAKNAIDASMQPSTTTLRTGLDYLATTDLRKTVRDIQQPTLILHGDNDAIIPASAGQSLAESIPHAIYHLFKQCGHAPFLTQHTTFNATVETWCLKI